MTIEEMQKKVLDAGLTKPCYVFNDSEAGREPNIIIRTRRQAKIADGLLVGTEISLSGKSEFCVWTDKSKTASRIARQHPVKVRHFNGEVELMVPGNLADTILPQFDMKQRRVMTPEQRAVSAARLADFRNKAI